MCGLSERGAEISLACDMIGDNIAVVKAKFQESNTDYNRKKYATELKKLRRGQAKKMALLAG
tara:strand:- start:301 stop:486 length:186 start_codon:yes stop_codon:yes gene_type:complete